MRILIVDDDKDVRETSRSILELVYHHEVQTAADGDEAIRLAKAWKPDAVLMDLVMPGLDGCAATERLRALPGFSQLKIIACSAFADDRQWRERAMACGINACVAKPFDFAALQRLLYDN